MIPGSDEHLRLLEVARGERPADLVVRGGTIANVYSGEFLPGHVAVSGGHIAYVGNREGDIGDETEVIDAGGMTIAPGYIEAHNHPWAMYNPSSLIEGVLPLGTTTLVADNLFFFMQMGVDGLSAMMDDLRDAPLDYLWVARLASQAKFPGERGMFACEKIRRLLDRDDVIGTAEVTRWTALASGDADILAGIAEARSRRKRSDGHTGGASEARLPALVAAGIDADHEAITKEELLHRLRFGLWAMMRHSSLRPDLPELLRAVVEDGVDTRRLMMTTDGPSPEHLAEGGFVDGMLRLALENGVPPMTALQMVTVNPATWLGRDHETGGLAPGRRANILLPNLEDFRPELVISGGKVVAKGGKLLAELPRLDWDEYGARPRFAPNLPLDDPGFYPPRAKGEEVEMPMMKYKAAVITGREDRRFPVEDRKVVANGGAMYAALVDRGGGWVSRGLVSGFADGVEGLASTYNNTTHLLVAGRDTAAMALAATRVRKMDGGVALAEGGEVVFEFPLTVCGMMSRGSFDENVEANRRLSAEMKKRGYPFHDIVYSLLFFTCDFLPSIRLTPLGVIEVKTGNVLSLSEEIPG
ncbi:MAG: adenine deaminase [Rubrobacter sp.]|nr:adenine deaminase [Rubrobacter sp.]